MELLLFAFIILGPCLDLIVSRIAGSDRVRRNLEANYIALCKEADVELMKQIDRRRKYYSKHMRDYEAYCIVVDI